MKIILSNGQVVFVPRLAMDKFRKLVKSKGLTIVGIRE
jgi:hypothetical protein